MWLFFVSETKNKVEEKAIQHYFGHPGFYIAYRDVDVIVQFFYYIQSEAFKVLQAIISKSMRMSNQKYVQTKVL